MFKVWSFLRSRPQLFLPIATAGRLVVFLRLCVRLHFCVFCLFAPFASQVAREIWPDAPEFSASQSYSMRAPVEKELYRATKQLFESREGAIEKWVKAYETTSALRARAREQTDVSGRLRKCAELHGALYDYCLKVSRTHGGRCARGSLRSKLATLVPASKEARPDASSADGEVRSDWITRRARSFMAQPDLRYRSKSIAIRATTEELQRGMGRVWRNAIRLRAWAGEGVAFDAYGHTPFFPMDERRLRGRNIRPS